MVPQIMRLEKSGLPELCGVSLDPDPILICEHIDDDTLWPSFLTIKRTVTGVLSIFRRLCLAFRRFDNPRSQKSAGSFCDFQVLSCFPLLDLDSPLHKISIVDLVTYHFTEPCTSSHLCEQSLEDNVEALISSVQNEQVGGHAYSSSSRGYLCFVLRFAPQNFFPWSSKN